MGFIAVCTAVYDYQPQSSGELELHEGELLYILEKSTEDAWWKARKKADGDDEDEPEGLIPNNYVEEAKPSHKAKALYDYTRQTDEEVSFSEEAVLDVYDVSDPDWTLVGINGEYGFAPGNYIELASEAAPLAPVAPPRPVIATSIPEPEPEAHYQQEPSPPASPARSLPGLAVNSAQIVGSRPPPSPTTTRNVSLPTAQRQFTPDASEEEEEAPALPTRPRSQTVPAAPPPPPQIVTEPSGVMPSPPYRGTPRLDDEDTPIRSPGGFRLYNISEMVSAMGRRKKMPVVLGLNVATGTISLAPEKSEHGPDSEWTADKMQHYSIEGKHVFLELVRPAKSLDLHAGTKDTAAEIVAALGVIAGAHRAAGLKEVISAASGGQKKGIVLYDFMAQGEDEVTVAEGDEIVILDDTKSEEWWNVRRIKNGKEGVMPRQYIEITGMIALEPPGRSGVNAGRSTVEQNRLEEERLAREAAKLNRPQRDAEDARSQRELKLPERGSSLGEEERRSKKDKRSTKSEGKSRSKPDTTKTRTWTDHSGSFKVEAQFLGIADGKIHLHKVNGVKIAVPVQKMSQTDLDYIEKMKRKNQPATLTQSGATIDVPKAQRPAAPEYDWFDFFLSSGVGPHQCERYAQAFSRDSMDESVLSDISIENLRTLGLKEGDALKVMKYLDTKFGRNKPDGASSEGGMFSGPGGVLKKNTSRQRPEVQRQTGNVVDASAFKQGESPIMPAEAQATPLAQAPAREVQNGFDDDAWTVKSPADQSASRVVSTSTPAPVAPAKPQSDNFQALSLLDKPLEPTSVAPPPRPASQPQTTQIPQQQTAASLGPQVSQPTGANAHLFSQVAQVTSQPTGTSQLGVPRQRPQAPQQSFMSGTLLPPPPRPTSAPQQQQNQIALQPLQSQLTGAARPAGPGQSLDELTAQRMQQQYVQMQSQPTGYGQPGFGFSNGIQPQPTGFMGQQFNQFQQPYLNGNTNGSPFADPRPSFQPQPTGFGSFQQQNPGVTGINAMLPPALTPQKTSYQPPPQMPSNGYNQFQQQQQTQQMQPQPTGFGQFQTQPTGFSNQTPLQSQMTGFGQQNGFGNQQLPPVPPIPQSTTPAPLVPQKTGPAPDVKFGVSGAKKLQPQPTGRRANLAAATPNNPFGF